MLCYDKSMSAGCLAPILHKEGFRLEYNAFDAGVHPGGLRNKDEIRILLCYMLCSVGALSKDAILSIIQENGFANYFEVTDALAELEERGTLLRTEDGLYAPGDTARLVAKQLDTALPSSVRRRARQAAVQFLTRTRLEQENLVEIRPTEWGYEVECHISGGAMELMSLRLYVPDRTQAEQVKQNFHRQPDVVYRAMLAMLTGQDKPTLEELLREWGAPDSPAL